jgi:integrase
MKEKFMITKVGGLHRLEVTVNNVSFVHDYKRLNDAEEMEEKLKSLEVSLEENGDISPKTRLGYVGTILIDQNQRTKTLATVKKKMSSLQHLKHLAGRPMVEISNEELVDAFRYARGIVTGKPLRQGTLKIMKATLKELFAIVFDMGFQRTNLRMVWAEIDKIIKDAIPAKQKRSLIKEDIITWFTSPEMFSPEVRWLSKLLLLTGSRISELLGCTWDKVCFESRTIKIEQMVSGARYAKRIKMYAKPYTIKMCDMMFNILIVMKKQNDLRGDKKSDWLFGSLREVNDFPVEDMCPYKGRPMCVNNFSRNMKQDMRNAGIEVINVHGLRISSASLDYIDNISDPFIRHRIMKRLNHKNFTTSEGYIQIAENIIEREKKGKIDNGLSWLADYEDAA